MKHFTLLFGFALLFFAACSDNDDKELQPLTFEKQSYEVQMEINNYIPICSGNGQYTVAVGDTDIISANADPLLYENAPLGLREIAVLAKKKGKTYIDLTDDLTSEKVRLDIRVTDAYLGHEVVESKHPLFTTDRSLCLAKSHANDFYLFSYNKASGSSELVVRGNFEFRLEYKTVYLLLKYKDPAMGDVTYTFDIIGSTDFLITTYNDFFELGWIKQYPKSSPVKKYILKMKDVSTGLEATLVLSSSVLVPEGVID